MKYKDSDPFKVVVIRLLIILLAVNIASLIWLVRRDQRDAAERSARIAQFQQQGRTQRTATNARMMGVTDG